MMGRLGRKVGQVCTLFGSFGPPMAPPEDEAVGGAICVQVCKNPYDGQIGS